MAKVNVTEIEELAIKILTKHGFSPAHSREIYEHMIYNEHAGRASHGFVRLKWTIDYVVSGVIKHPENTPIREVDKPAFKLIDGQGTLGLIAANRATEAAIEGAKQAGSCTVGAYNYGGTTGNIGYYARKITDAGLVCTLSATALTLVSPAPHCKPVNGTNPLCIGIPAGKGKLPIIYDSAVSKISWGNTTLAAINGDELPEGVALDGEHNPTTDARAVKNGGSLLPIAEHKGYGLGVALELLAGPLVRAKAGNSVAGSDGLYINTFDPACFGDKNKFFQDVEDYSLEIKSSPSAAHNGAIRLPGEKSLNSEKQNKNKPFIELSDKIYQHIKELAL